MRRSILCFLTAILILLPCLLTGTAGAGEVRSFLYGRSDTDADGTGECYVLRFSEALSEEEIRSRLSGLEYESVGPVSDRIYRIRAGGIDAFRERNGEDLLYCCTDEIRSLAAAPAEPDPQDDYLYDQIRLAEARSLVTPDPGLVIAVLDTGVAREHEAVAGVSILEGYDFIEKHAGVYTDGEGHGTAVTGLIAARTYGGTENAGICPGVAILPVRVADGNRSVYSSDFVAGLRYAADAGAKIINLSFGGYSYSAAEDDAVQYAVSRGCILIAAVGNDGETPHASELYYPASYEGVVGVGSCGPGGERSAFSQNNDSVVVLAPGEGLSVPGTGDEGESVYFRKSGTSYAAAVVTGIAGLVVSAVDEGVRFGAEEFRALLSEETFPEPGTGYGPVDAFLAVSRANEPQITGVLSGRIYSSRITIRYNRGAGLLDGEEFADGDTVYENGNHRLIVTDGAVRKTVFFRLSYSPASYDVRRENGGLSVTFSGGTATMDGLPYESGAPVTGEGVHRFVLTDAVGVDTEEYVSLHTEPPALSGASDGEQYDRPVRIATAGAGTVFLNGTKLKGSVILTEDGTYELTAAAEDGDASRTVTFRIARNGRIRDDGIPYAGVYVDEEHGWYGICSGLTGGMRICSLETDEEIGTLDTGIVRRIARTDAGLVVCGDGFAALLDPASPVPDEEENLRLYPVEGSAAVCAGGRVFLLSGGILSEMDMNTGERISSETVTADGLVTDGETLWLVRTENGTVTDYASGRTFALPAEIDGPLSAAGDWLFGSGYALLTGTSGISVRFLYDGDALFCADGSLYTTEAVYRLEDGTPEGRYGETFSNIFFSASSVWVCRQAGGICEYPAGESLTAPLPETLLPPPGETSVFHRTYAYFRAGEADAVAADRDRFCLIFGEAQRIVIVESGTVVSEVDLPFRPSSAVMDGDTVCVLPVRGNCYWTDGELRDAGFHPEKAFYSAHALYLFGNGTVRPADGDASSARPAADADGKGGLTVRLEEGILYAEPGNLSLECSADRVWTDGSYIIAGTSVYLCAEGTLSYVTELTEEPVAVCGGCAAIPGALVRLADGKILSEYRQGSTGTALGEFCGVLFLSPDGELIQCVDVRSEGADGPVWAEPVLEGCGDGYLYRERTRIAYDRGEGFLDGRPLPSGTEITEPGTHTFRIVLPCGISLQSTFRIVPALTGIAFLRPYYRLAVSEEGRLPVVYLPEEASSVSVFYTADSECIELRGDGTFRAVGEGRTTVTARTEDGKFSAQCRVIVTAALLRFTEDSGYTVDWENGLLLNVPENTSSEEVLSHAVSAGQMTASAETAGTGTVLRLLAEDGTVLDELTVVVTGDTDGDGYVTLRDLMLLEACLESGEFGSPAVKQAADISGSGGVTSYDVNRLRSQLLFERESGTRVLPPREEEGLEELLVPAVLREGNTVRVLIGLKECASARGANGRLIYPADRLAYAGYESYGWESTVSAVKKGQVAFISRGAPAQDLHPVIALLFTVLPAEEGGEPGEIQLRDLTVVREDRVSSFLRRTKKLPAVSPANGELGIHAEGMTPDFDPETGTYELSLPYDTFWVDCDAVCPEGATVEYGSPVFANGNRLELTFLFHFADGTEKQYVLNAYRDGIRPKSGDSRLAVISVEGYDLQFSPSKTDYALTVPRGTAGLNIHYETAQKAASVEYGETRAEDGESFDVLLTVTAEDGTQTVYRIVCRYEKEPDPPAESEVPAPSGESVNPVPFIAAGCAAAAVIGAVLVLLFRKRKKKTSGRKG